MYKSILWIEDFQVSQAPEGDLDEFGSVNEGKPISRDEDKKTMFGTLKDRVMVLDKTSRALDYIDEHTAGTTDFDLVILDLNMENGGKDYNEIKKHLAKRRVTPKCENNSEFLQYMGFYIYLYLIMGGFPPERVKIHSAYYGGDLEKDNKIAESYLQEIIMRPDPLISNSSEKKGCIEQDIKMLYSCNTENSYYAVRTVVFSALDYWENIIKNLNFKREIALNSVFDTNYSVNEFIAEFGKIKNLFTITCPSQEQINEGYFLVLKSLARFHENKCDLHKVRSNKKLYGLHNLVRQFRNWSSHGILTADGLDTQRFIILFFAILRVLFDTYQILKDCGGEKKSESTRKFQPETFPYEKMWFTANEFEENNISISREHAERLLNCWVIAVQKTVKNTECRHGIKSFSDDQGLLSELLRSYYSRTKSHKAGYNELFLLAVDKKEFCTNKDGIKSNENPEIKLFGDHCISINVRSTITVSPKKYEFTAKKLNTDDYHFLQKYIIIKGIR